MKGEFLEDAYINVNPLKYFMMHDNELIDDPFGFDKPFRVSDAYLLLRHFFVKKIRTPCLF